LAGPATETIVKTGRLIKFPRPGGDIQAYIYRDGATFHGRLYVLRPGGSAEEGPAVHSVSGATETAVERAVRDWVDAHYPRPS
jgi:hypothetical protein